MSALNRRLVVDPQRVKTAKQHRKPCADCPWARTALKGWLGAYSALEWVQMAHGEHRIDCHCTSNQECAGAAIYRSNVIKVCRDGSLLRLPGDKKLVFGSPVEFLDHHNQG